MRIDKFLQKNKNLDIEQLREKLLDISKLELVEMLVETIQNTPTPEQTIKPEPIRITDKLYKTLIKLIDDNFVVIGADGRGRKSVYDTEGYFVAVQRILNNYKSKPEQSTSQFNLQLKQLYLREYQRRKDNNEDITNFHKTYIKKGVIYNEPEQ